jgi:hypothetical protein
MSRRASDRADVVLMSCVGNRVDERSTGWTPDTPPTFPAPSGTQALLCARDGRARSFPLSWGWRRPDVDSSECRWPQGIHIRENAQTTGVIYGVNARLDERCVCGVVDDVLQLIQNASLKDLHQIGSGVKPRLVRGLRGRPRASAALVRRTRSRRRSGPRLRGRRLRGWMPC